MDNEKLSIKSLLGNPWIIGFGVTVIGGVAVVFFQALFLKSLENLSFDEMLQKIRGGFLVGAIFAAALFLAVSFIHPKSRGAWVSFGRSVCELRILSSGKRNALKETAYQQGYKKRSDEVAAERKSVRIPFWEIRQRDQYFYLYNWGNLVGDVRLTVPAEYFVMNDDSGWWKEGWNDGIGKQFHGHLTSKGRSEGVDFSVRWLDENGDEQTGTSSLHQGQIMPFETAPEAYERGRAAGLAHLDEQQNLSEDGQDL